MIEVGSVLPEITLKDEQGNTVSTKDLRGTYVVLYAYPKDDTPGCTKEACSFRDSNVEMQKLGVRVIGISKDSPESHKKFIEKYHLNFPLWSDEDLSLLQALGAYGEKTMFGKTALGIKRSTFVFDPKGEVIKVWKSVKPEGHAEQVYAFMQKELAKK